MTDDATKMKQERDLALADNERNLNTLEANRLTIDRLTAECERLRADAERKRNLLISIKTFVKHTYPDAEKKGVWVEPLRLIDAAIDAVRGKP